MAKPASKTHATGGDETLGLMPGLFPIDRMFRDNGQSLDAWTEMNKTLMDRLAAWQTETTRFMAKRFEEDMTSQRELAGCRSPSEALELYSAFTRKAMQDYLEEAGKVSDIASEMTRACATFGETLTATAVQAAKSEGDRAPTPMTATAKATEDARSEIAA